jgi:hypothetical protein
MNAQIIEAVVAVAKEDAVLFFSEFQTAIDTSSTDWDAEAWSESKIVVSEIDGNADPAEYHQMYMSVLEAETRRLAMGA